MRKCLHISDGKSSPMKQRLNQKRARKLQCLEPTQRAQIPDLKDSKFQLQFFKVRVTFILGKLTSFVYRESSSSTGLGERPLSHQITLIGSQGRGENK